MRTKLMDNLYFISVLIGLLLGVIQLSVGLPDALKPVFLMVIIPACMYGIVRSK